MLRHLGTKRTYEHNAKLAALLSLTAGFINAAGFLAFNILTTNVTGHAALFAERIATSDWDSAWIIAAWMLLFLAGAFVSGLVINRIGPNQRFAYVIPILAEILIIVLIALGGKSFSKAHLGNEIMAGSLLFIMGMQNALVSIASDSLVRTTHLTGTFTDLGIELAQLLPGPGHGNQNKLQPKIKLRVIIIGCFMGGALVGAILIRSLHFWAFLLPAICLSYTLLYDILNVPIRRKLLAFRASRLKT